MTKPINVLQINEESVQRLARLLRDKSVLVEALKAIVSRLDQEPKPSLMMTIKYGDGRYGSALIDTSSNHLEAALTQRSDWIIDAVYNQAITNIEAEIATVADSVLTNLIKAAG